MDALKQRVTREDVISAYRLILGRDPETESVVDEQMARHESLLGLRNAFLNQASSKLGSSLWDQPPRLCNSIRVTRKRT